MKRPTIAELEKILSSSENKKIDIRPDGSIHVVSKETAELDEHGQPVPNPFYNPLLSALDKIETYCQKQAFSFEDHCALMDAKHPDWLKGNNHGATSLLSVAKEFWEAARTSEALAVSEQSFLELGAECPVCFPEGFDHDAKPDPVLICPQCGSNTVQPRDSTEYCEECGWPNENREPNLWHRLWDRLLDF